MFSQATTPNHPDLPISLEGAGHRGPATNKDANYYGQSKLTLLFRYNKRIYLRFVNESKTHSVKNFLKIRNKAIGSRAIRKSTPKIAPVSTGPPMPCDIALAINTGGINSGLAIKIKGARSEFHIIVN